VSLTLDLSPDLTAVLPRYGTPRNEARPTRGGVDGAVARMLGWPFFPWQQLVSDVAGEFDPQTKRPFFRTVGVGVARQNGKTTLVCTRVARQLIVPRQTVAYTAQDRGLARLKWMEHVELLMETPFADRVDRVEKQRTQECLYMKNNSRYLPVTPSAKKAGRSLSLDLAVIDEAYAHETMGVVSALNPTMITRKHAQLWVLSNAGDETSVLWRHYTDLGRGEVDKPDSTVAWFEWAAAPDAEVGDVQADFDANPSLGLPGGVDPDALRSAAASATTPEAIEVYKKEHLNIWSSEIGGAVIDPVAWASCWNDTLRPGDRVVFGLDFNESRDRGALVVSGLVDGEVTPLEVIESGADLERLVARAAANAIAAETFVVIAHGSPAASSVPALEKLTAYRHNGRDMNRVRVISTSDQARASGDFYDAAKNARVAHRADYRLTASVKNGRKRKVQDAWTWLRDGESSELIAATNARFGMLTAPPPPPPPVAVIRSAVDRRIPSRR
jgi:hypothetical protein